MGSDSRDIHSVKRHSKNLVSGLKIEDFYRVLYSSAALQPTVKVSRATERK